MNIQQWLLARREGRLSALPLGMSVAMTSSCDVFSVACVHGNDDGDDFGNRNKHGNMYELRNRNGNGEGNINGNGYGDGDGFRRRNEGGCGYSEGPSAKL